MNSIFIVAKSEFILNRDISCTHTLTHSLDVFNWKIVNWSERLPGHEDATNFRVIHFNLMLNYCIAMQLASCETTSMRPMLSYRSWSVIGTVSYLYAAVTFSPVFSSYVSTSWRRAFSTNFQWKFEIACHWMWGHCMWGVRGVLQIAMDGIQNSTLVINVEHTNHKPHHNVITISCIAFLHF